MLRMCCTRSTSWGTGSSMLRRQSRPKWWWSSACARCVDNVSVCTRYIVGVIRVQRDMGRHPLMRGIHWCKNNTRVHMQTASGGGGMARMVGITCASIICPERSMHPQPTSLVKPCVPDDKRIAVLVVIRTTPCGCWCTLPCNMHNVRRCLVKKSRTRWF